MVSGVWDSQNDSGSGKLKSLESSRDDNDDDDDVNDD